MSGDVISCILRDIKYAVPSATDKNVSRWPMADFWRKAIGVAEKKLQSHISHAQRKMILEGCKQEISAQYEKSIAGQTVSYAALHGMDVSEVPMALDMLGESLIGRIRGNPEKFQKKHQKMTEKYSQLK